jgi:DNA-binding transcriptional MerR regulator
MTVDSSPGEGPRMPGVDEHISIGQFASLTWLSPKALRLYQAQGLLEPAVVDPSSGYRYYSSEQVARGRTIGLLRRAGISLAEISAYLRAPSPAQVERWQDDLEAEVAERRRLLAHIAQNHEATEAPMSETTTTDTTFERAIPVLASLDLEATQRFYVDKLGFTAGPLYPDYAICERDGVQVHFWLTEDEDIPKATSCRIDVVGIGRLYEEMRDAGVVHPNGSLTEQPWGFREFAVLDGDGNLIKFGERT